MAEAPNPLSEREQEILHLVATGATNQQVARELNISVNTVKVHLRNVYSKIGAESRTEATMWAVHQGIIVVPNSQQDDEAGLEVGQATAGKLEAALQPLQPISLAKRLLFVSGALVVLALAVGPLFLHSSARSDTIVSNAFADQERSPGGRALSPTSRWSSRAQMPSPRARLAATTLDGQVYIIGGDVGGTTSDEVEAFDPASNTWRIGSPKPTAVSNIGAVAVAGMVYVPGGMLSDGEVTGLLEAYDPSADTWTTLSPLPSPVCAYAIALLDERIYLFGGWDGSTYLDTVFVYDTRSDEWSQGTSMSIARAFAGAGTLRNSLYVIGGYDGEREFDLCEEYRPELEGGSSSPWRALRPMSSPRGGLAVAVVGDSLFAVGGGWLNYLAYNERYDPRSDTWFSFETPIIGQWRNLGLAAVDVSLYALGGWSGKYLSTNEEYQALYRIILPMSITGLRGH